MENANYRVNIVKWLPFPSPELESWFTECLEACKTGEKYSHNIVEVMVAIQKADKITPEQTVKLNEIIPQIEDFINIFTSIWSRKGILIPPALIYEFKMENLSSKVMWSLKVLSKFCRDLIFTITSSYTPGDEQCLITLFGLVNVYNKTLDLDGVAPEKPFSLEMYLNDAPSIWAPVKKISIHRILKTIAKDKSEENCHKLIDCLLKNYQPKKDKDEDDEEGEEKEEEEEQEEKKSRASWDGETSENSSVEIYRALTKHMTPPGSFGTRPVAGPSTTSYEKNYSPNLESLKSLVKTHKHEADEILKIAINVSPQLFGPANINNNTILKNYRDNYQRMVWTSISGILDHVVLWWSQEPLAVSHKRGALHLKNWLHQFIQYFKVPSVVRPALMSLCDALGYHVAITGWDELFRLAYTSAFECASGGLKTGSRKQEQWMLERTNTGQMFSEVFKLLVTLSNECEVGGEWVVGAPLEELPLSEQIVIHHRLDHSIHTMRLWAIQESRTIAHTWDLANFFRLVKGDLVSCIDQLSYLKLADHTKNMKSDSVSVQVYVCARMRTKIVSEVLANFQLLKEAPVKCISILGKICRVVSLANLHMCFPKFDYWRRSGSSVELPVTPSSYVDVYLGQVLLPVLEVIDDAEISNTVLTIMCEAWLDYIYLHRIKFSEFGAFQLLTDFAHVSRWITDCSILSQGIREHLLKNELLRRCEGVGRLLLRHPGEAIVMHSQLSKTNENGSPQSLGLERMPAEMYVPNQQQWLELRAPKLNKFYSCFGK